MKHLVVCLTLLALAAPTMAVQSGTVLYLASTGKGQGTCVDGVCSQWSTTVWVHNPHTTPVSVRVSFLARNKNNSSAPTFSVTIAPTQTYEWKDIMGEAFGLDDQFGALRFTATKPIVVTSRIADTNVQTNKGTGSAGQFFAGQSVFDSLALLDASRVIGLAQEGSGANRSNFGAVEVTGKPCTVTADLMDGRGVIVGTVALVLQPFDQQQRNLSVFGVETTRNHQIRFTVSAGEGRALAFGSFLDNLTGDPSTMEMHVRGFDPAWLVGTWTGLWYNTTFASQGDATFTVAWTPDNQTLSITVDLDGNVFGGADPPPENFKAKFGRNGFTFSGASQSFGFVSVDISPDGTVSGSLSQTGGGIERVNVAGNVGPGTVTLRGDIVFSGGSGSALSYVVVHSEN